MGSRTDLKDRQSSRQLALQSKGTQRSFWETKSVTQSVSVRCSSATSLKERDLFLEQGPRAESDNYQPVNTEKSSIPILKAENIRPLDPFLNRLLLLIVTEYDSGPSNVTHILGMLLCYEGGSGQGRAGKSATGFVGVLLASMMFRQRSLRTRQALP